MTPLVRKKFAGGPRRGVQTVGDVVQLGIEQVPMEIQRLGRGFVSEHLLDDLHAGAGGETGCGVPKGVRRDPRQAGVGGRGR